MSISAAVSATMGLVCISFVFILFIYNFFYSEKKNSSDSLFLILSFAVIMELIGVTLGRMCVGTGETWYPYVVRICIFIAFLFSCLIQLIYINYLACYMNIPQKSKGIIRQLTYLYTILYVASMLFNLKYGFYYRVERATNTYILGKAWWVTTAVCLVPIALDIYLVIKYRKNVHKAAWLGTFIFIVISPISAIIEYNTGYPFNASAMSIALYVVFFNIKTQQSFILEKQRKELAESRISIMLSQIQPHFMYNALTTIAVLCEKDPAAAKRATSNFSRYLRKNIDSMNKRMPVPFSSELEHIQTYIELEKLRFGDRLNVVTDITTKDFLIPSLTIQPLVENAVKHGICNKPDGTGTITVATRENQNSYEIIISDDGVGFDPSKKPDDGKEHIGMENVRNRLKSLVDGKIAVQSEIGVGTVITVTIPKNANKNQGMYS